MAGYEDILKSAGIFYRLTTTQLELVANLGEEHSFKAEEIIFREGEDSDALYVVIQGIVEIIVNPLVVTEKSGEGRIPITIATLKKGESFGEVALVDQGLRSATARASKTPTRLLVIPREKLLQLSETYPQIGYRLMRNLASDLALKIRSTDLRIREELLYRKIHDT